MREKFDLKGFFFEIYFAGCQKVKTESEYYGEHSVRFSEPAHYWKGQACIKDRENGQSHKFLLSTGKITGRQANDLEEYIFGSDSLEGKPFTLEDSTCKEAVIDYLARIMLKELKGSGKNCIIAEISVPQICLERLQKFGLAPKAKSNPSS